ncbi:DNA-processing protein DprA [Leifsonia sp. H3M29-4]|uniref:DNA-processing protein DprA n=1 Tax=Salinibacterium metalliresistens TaxID=3031321 RepID=UPI0023DB901E|nr:DNA-processing protein DprA [Salinibacterium metalliresistens]MDF1478730.1 DNA-processing protein DprA [Salinibacterium metalliresistens]
MSMFGLKEAEVAELVRAITARDLDRDAIEERFARATWTAIAEPGDRVAGRLIAVLGAPRALAAVVERWSPAELAAAVNGLPETELDQAQQRWQPRLNSSNALLALRQAARFGTRLRVPGDALWPDAMDDLGDHAPLALWTRGTDAALEAIPRSMALVGARAATGYGEHITMEASAGLVDRGYAIVSGAAYGIDGMAHRAALASHGQTVAFLAGGVDRFYPTGHEALLTRIVEHGVVVSELPPGSAPTKWRFLQRNRLIAAAGRATIVLEAGWRSGSINTAGHANDLSRPVGAVPGPVTSAASAGCHRLIREHGATLVTTPEEMAELAPLQPAAPHAAGAASDPDGTRVLDALSTRSPRQPRDIAARAGLSVADVEAVLGRLDLDGIVHEAERGWLRRAR